MNEDYESEEDNGFHFDPSEQEVIQEYLKPTLNNESIEGDFIVMKDVYAKEPWLLDHTNNPFLMEDEWYYFTKRTQVSKEKIGCGSNVKRRITGENNDGIGRGYWKAADKESIIDEETENVIGFKQSMTFISSKDTHKKRKKQKIENRVSTAFVQGSEDSWIMKEFTLPDQNQFQELVICKITRKKVSKNKVVHRGEASSFSSNQQQSINIDREAVQLSCSNIQAISTTSCNVAEKEINIHHNGEGEEEDMVNQIDIILSTNLENDFEKDEEYIAAIMAINRDEGDAPNMEWMDLD